MKRRHESWEDLKRLGACDVLILGGGVNGAGLLRDLARQGLRCVLVDKGDFASGASSKSSRMIHGGLRYLENAEFKLVAEAVRERNRLLRDAPHYVRPLKTTIPIRSWLAGLVKSPLVFLGLPVTPGGRGAAIVKFGLSFYDLVTGRQRQTPRHFFTSKAGSLAEMPGLRRDIVCTATYWDAWISESERLCVTMIADACRSNPECAALNYVAARKGGDDTVVLRDETSGQELSLRPTIVVNATGAWVDLTNRALGFESHFMGGTKGSHLVVDHPELYEALGDRMIYYEHEDGRICIVFRFMDKVIVGSTDIRVENPDEARCEDREIDYMIGTLRGVFPEIALTREQIVFTFCGVRPLPSSGLDYTSRVPRSHRIDVAAPAAGRTFAIYSLIGGKLTTFRALAEEAAEKILAQLARPRQASTRTMTYPGAEAYPKTEAERTRWIERAAAASGLDPQRVTDLLTRYGTEAERLAAQADSGWRTPLRTLPRYTVGEIRHLAETESVEHLTDLVRRRSIIMITGQANASAIEELATIAGDALGWDEPRRRSEVEATFAEAAGRA